MRSLSRSSWKVKRPTSGITFFLKRKQNADWEAAFDVKNIYPDCHPSTPLGTTERRFGRCQSEQPVPIYRESRRGTAVLTQSSGECSILSKESGSFHLSALRFQHQLPTPNSLLPTPYSQLRTTLLITFSTLFRLLSFSNSPILDCSNSRKPALNSAEITGSAFSAYMGSWLEGQELS